MASLWPKGTNNVWKTGQLSKDFLLLLKGLKLVVGGGFWEALKLCAIRPSRLVEWTVW